MPTTVPPSGPISSVLSDESALRQIFMAEYPALLADARTTLGQDAVALAPKVVEGAFVRAWDTRARFQTREQLHQFLVEDMHHAAARALSRRASAHRLGGAAPHPTHDVTATTPEESWGHVVQALRGESHSPAVLAQAAAASRHEAADHIKELSKETPWWRVAGITVVGVALVVGLVYYFDRLSADARTEAALSGNEVRVITAPTSQVANVTLDDGTIAHLAPETKLTIPTGFAKLRAVRLEGLGTFEVAKGQSIPFQVRTRSAAVVATGTSFTVKLYPSDDMETIIVHDGSVEVRRGDLRQTLGANSALAIVGTAAPRIATPEERDAADSWRRGVLMISNRPLREVLPQMKRWYGLTILPKDTALLERRVFLRASLDSARQAINAIEKSAGVEFGYVGQNMVFQEPAAKGKAKGR